MTTPHRSDTATRPEGLDARLEATFVWLFGPGRRVLLAIGGLLLVGAIVAGALEYLQYAEGKAQFALSEVEDRFALAMGNSIDVSLVPEPADKDQAQAAREEALAGFDAVITDHAQSRAADIARIRAATMALDLGQLEEADRRLTEAAEQLGKSDALKAIALRLQGHVRQEQERFGEAGASYAEAARVETYPTPGALWIAAGENFARSGLTDEAINAFQEALSEDPELAEQAGVIDRLNALTAQ